MLPLCIIIIISLKLTSVSSLHECNILDFGAKGDGKSNDTNAILQAITHCNTYTDSPVQLLFPSNYIFKTWPFQINGANIPSNQGFNIKGSSIKIGSSTTIFNGINNTNDWPSQSLYPSLIHLEKLKNGFSMIGSNPGHPNIGPNPQFDSIIDGMGEPWWILRKKTPSEFAPKLIEIHDCNDIIVAGLTLQNSPMFHLPTSSNTNVLITNMTIVAPSDSPNTDAIDVGSSTNVNVQYNYLATGDDNVAIGSGSQNIYVQVILIFSYFSYFLQKMY